MTSKNSFGVAVIGLGRFGSKRIATILKNSRTQLRTVSDVNPQRTSEVGEQMNCAHTAIWQEAVNRADVDVVVVSTSTESLASIALGALQAGKHVLCEKPFGRTADEVLPAVVTARNMGLTLKVGYNHRYHPALRKAHQLLQQGVLGKLHFLHCFYGHGGRAGYEQEWRTRASSAGGGQLLDQGVHALDLFRWFAGDFLEVKATAVTSFWPIAPLEDNVFALLRNESGCVAQLHASWTSWKNNFQFMISGERGQISVTGLGGAYGIEHMVHGVCTTLGSPPQESSFEFPQPDESLHLELDDYLDCIEQGREPQSSGQDAWKTLKLAESIYAAADVRFQTVDDQSIAIPA
jgi:predicted dehydrogenase